MVATVGTLCYTLSVMNSSKIDQLTRRAEERMTLSRDQLHDLSHVRRVVQSVETFAVALGCDERQREALRLAAWWHDVSRTLSRRPSIIFMPFFDDILSALFLWRESIRCGVFGSVVGTATRMIFGKSIGTGKILTKILMRKKNRILTDILQDADMLDVLNIERTKNMYALVEASRMYHFSYKLMIWWFLSLQKLQLKTTIAKKQLAIVLHEFLAWIQERDMLLWHIDHFGRTWVEKNIARAKIFLHQLQSFLEPSPPLMQSHTLS